MFYLPQHNFLLPAHPHSTILEKHFGLSGTLLQGQLGFIYTQALLIVGGIDTF